MGKEKRIFVIDGTSCFYRAFHAIPHFSTSKGVPTNAVYGFAQTLRKILKDYTPEYICIAFDVKGPTVRHEKFEGYKAARPPMPEPLVEQLPLVKRLVEAFNIPLIERQGYEADDIIAAVTREGRAEGLKVTIVSSDKDLCQLVDETTVVLDYAKGKELGPAEVHEKFGVEPVAIVDLIALAGDSSDNIPGIPGIGVKTAAKLIAEFGSLDEILANIDSVKGAKLKEKLSDGRESALISRELATLHADIEVDFDLNRFASTEPDMELLAPLLKELELQKLYEEMVPPEGSLVTASLVSESKGLRALVKSLKKAGGFSCHLLFDNKGEKRAGEPPLGLSIVVGKADVSYISVGEGEIDEELLISELKGLFEDEHLRKDTDDAKALYLYLLGHGVSLNGVQMDTSLASYLLNPSRNDHSIDAVAFQYLSERPEALKPPFSSLSTEERSAYSAERAVLIEKASTPLKDMLKAEGLLRLYNEMELPLSEVLADMELCGIKVDLKLLKALSKEVGAELERLEAEIYRLAGERFNINSPKQLSELFFVKMGIEPIKKTKTGFSTDESVLRTLAEEYELPENILNFRQLAKLKSTYIDAIVELADPETKRVHTSFNQTVTATGRLSSSRPNLQNIPVRDEYSRRIREAFIAEEGFLFLSADYSQIELRLLAHMSEDPELIRAFAEDADIHTVTAAEVFGIMPGLVTEELRRRAKAINFGIVYGMGAYGLSKDLDISINDAADFIDSYFAHYSRVKEFIDSTIVSAEELGYSKTLYGRKRPIPELKSRSRQTRGFGERIAINAPIQGTAADMIKAAMIKIHHRMKDEGLKSSMILQIHDELFFEVPEEEQEVMAELVRTEMEWILELKVPVRVKLKAGADWSKVE